MRKVIRVVFEYDDGSMDSIDDPRTALLFQSRCNSSGIFAGLYNELKPVKTEEEADE